MTAASQASPTPPDAEPHHVAPEADDSQTESEKFILEMLQRLDAADTEAGNLRQALVNSRDIGAAVGILMVQH
ncbi:MAG: hypothetical protein ABIS35_02855, partial [Terracoccus sp.]